MGYISSAVMNSGNTKSIFYPHHPRGKIQHCTFFPVKQSCPFSKPTSLSSDQKQLIATMGLLRNVLKKCQTTSPPNDFKIQFQALLHFCFLEQQIFSRHFKTKTPKSWKYKRQDYHSGDWRCGRRAGKLLWETSALRRECKPLGESSQVPALHFLSQLNVSFARTMHFSTLSNRNPNPLFYCETYFPRKISQSSPCKQIFHHRTRDVLYYYYYFHKHPGC